ncbi:Uncharacterised protein [Mycobacteroides abscessus subsp. bolletii]|nr:Uncharacterised protein [Mycobacteroides abscessus]SKF61597.1 Uncharacterised protein [Mycobacteroides abscessus subsp. bolletii]SKH86091.1 Uncharacterised protein [Mycobacteroides abscessus subsp. bolletii]
MGNAFIDTVATLKATMVQAAKESSLPRGVLPRPQIFVLQEGQDPALLGYAICRPYKRGADAAAAIAGLGHLASAMPGDHLLVFWEEADIRASLLGPSDDHPNGLAVLEASRSGQAPQNTLSWHPFDFDVMGYERGGLPRLNIRWQQTSVSRNPPLLGPIEHLLATWRRSEIANADVAAQAIQTAQDSGYEIALTKRTPGRARRDNARQPRFDESRHYWTHATAETDFSSPLFVDGWGDRSFWGREGGRYYLTMWRDGTPSEADPDLWISVADRNYLPRPESVLLKVMSATDLDPVTVSVGLQIMPPQPASDPAPVIAEIARTQFGLLEQDSSNSLYAFGQLSAYAWILGYEENSPATDQPLGNQTAFPDFRRIAAEWNVVTGILYEPITNDETRQYLSGVDEALGEVVGSITQ